MIEKFFHDEVQIKFENLSVVFPTKSDTIQAIQIQKMARGLYFWL